MDGESWRGQVEGLKNRPNLEALIARRLNPVANSDTQLTVRDINGNRILTLYLRSS